MPVTEGNIKWFDILIFFTFHDHEHENEQQNIEIL